MPNEMLHIVEFYDDVGEKNLVAFSSRVEAEEFMDLGLKRWHFSGLVYHYYSVKEFIEEKKKTWTL